MKNRSWYLVLSILCVSISFNSCTIKKRLYQPGYHVQWNKTVKEPNSTEVENVENSSELHSEAEATAVKQSIKAEQTFQPEIAAADEPIYASTEMNQFNTGSSKLPTRNRVFSLKTTKTTTAPINAKMRETFPTSIEEDKVKRKGKGLLIAAIFSGIIAFICIAIAANRFLAIELALTGILFGILTLCLFIAWGIVRSIKTAPINAKTRETFPTSIEEDKVKSEEKKLLKLAFVLGIISCIFLAGGWLMRSVLPGAFFWTLIGTILGFLTVILLLVSLIDWISNDRNSSDKVEIEKEKD